MTVKKALELFKKLEQDTFVQNLIAQSNAKNILLEANEPSGNFPNFTEGLDEKINYISFSYLSIACVLKEKKSNNEIALKAFEKAGDMIYYIHSPKNNRQLNSNYYLLLSSLSFYVSSQYSKSFITIKKAETNTAFIKLISLFLKKDLEHLNVEISNNILDDEYSDEYITQLDNTLVENSKFYTVILSKALSLIVEYIYSGNKQDLDLAQVYINDLKELSSIDDEPITWWISRLLLILLDTFCKYSFWNTLPSIIESEKTNLYIQKLAFSNPSIIELFYTQYEALKSMKDKRNIVISLPTSSGKTRIAEIAILETLVKYPESKVLYLAPFRSLSYEIEESMDNVFNPLGYITTFLYGGAQYSKIDKTLIEHSNIIIATPEKAKAIIRADEDIVNNIKLLVIDEGHLLGAEQRYIQNEMFIEELKFHINKNDGRIILLSAVLPNTKDISKWISKDENNIFQSDKRLANQRFGLLKWTKNKTINIEWFGKPVSFNNNFIEKFLPPKARSKYFPNDKNEGYASTALKLSQLGTVLLFVAQARYVVTRAKKILSAMGENKQKIVYKNINLFKSLKLACEEAGESDIFELAEYGILCHYGKISTDVRLLLEKIMREEKPKVIVSTSTLGQGVNIGISTVIFADVFMNHKERYKIDSKDFWNIAGRAGRAFTDIEGKILYAIDENKEQWKVKKDIELANQYFEPSNMEKAKSGLLSLIKTIKVIAGKCNVSFELLLQLIAENDLSKLNIAGEDYSENIKEAFSWIDDTLLALDYKKEAYLDTDPSEWIDDYFRNSLAYIQAEKEQNIAQAEIIEFLKARNKAVLKIAGDYNNWESIIKSAIPLSSSILIKEYIDTIKEIISIYIQSEKNITDTIKLVKKIEKIIERMPSTSFKNNFNKDELKIVRKQWFSGIALSKIKESPDAHKICNEYFGMTIPWAINAIVRKLYDLDLENEAKVLEDIALFSEIGLSNKVAIKIYLSGIKSRVSALDLSQVINDDFNIVSKKELLRLLVLHKKKIKTHCSKITLQWIKAYSKNEDGNANISIPKFSDFTLDKAEHSIKNDILNVRQYNDKTYLCSSDFQDMILIKSSKEFPFNDISNNLGLYFKYDEMFNSWTLLSRDSKLLLEK